jgi:hypothetical protein
MNHRTDWSVDMKKVIRTNMVESRRTNGSPNSKPGCTGLIV